MARVLIDAGADVNVKDERVCAIDLQAFSNMVHVNDIKRTQSKQRISVAMLTIALEVSVYMVFECRALRRVILPFADVLRLTNMKTC